MRADLTCPISLTRRPCAQGLRNVLGFRGSAPLALLQHALRKKNDLWNYMTEVVEALSWVVPFYHGTRLYIQSTRHADRLPSLRQLLW